MASLALASLPELDGTGSDSIGVDSLGVGNDSDSEGVGWASDSLAVELGIGITCVSLASVLLAGVGSGISLDELVDSGKGSRLVMMLSIGSRIPLLDVAEGSDTDCTDEVTGSGAGS